MSIEKCTIRCMNGDDLNYQTAPMSREAAEKLVKQIEELQTCSLLHQIHPVKRMQGERT